MANIKSQIKRNRQNERLRLRNKAVKAELRTRVKNALSIAAEGGEESEASLRLAVKRLDKAATKGVIHKNQAANRKSSLMRRIAVIASGGAAAADAATNAKPKAKAKTVKAKAKA